MSAVSVLGLLVFAGVANGQTPVAPNGVTSSTTLTRVGPGQYTLTTRGRVLAPAACVPGGGDHCVPPVCPPGNPHHPEYCSGVSTAQLCTGVVTVRVGTSTGRASSLDVRLRSDCTFRAAAPLRLRSRASRRGLRVSVLFRGNAFLLPQSSAVHTV